MVGTKLYPSLHPFTVHKRRRENRLLILSSVATILKAWKPRRMQCMIVVSRLCIYVIECRSVSY